MPAPPMISASTSPGLISPSVTFSAVASLTPSVRASAEPPPRAPATRLPAPLFTVLWAIFPMMPPETASSAPMMPARVRPFRRAASNSSGLALINSAIASGSFWSTPASVRRGPTSSAIVAPSSVMPPAIPAPVAPPPGPATAVPRIPVRIDGRDVPPARRPKVRVTPPGSSRKLPIAF